MPKTFTNVRDWLEHCDYLNAHPEEREVYVPRSSQSTADRVSNKKEDDMQSDRRINMHDITPPATTTDGVIQPSTWGAVRFTPEEAVMMARMRSGGKLPGESEAPPAALFGRDKAVWFMKHGGNPPKQGGGR
jgi:hypothetical protein